MTDENRKASDILISLEEKLNTVLKLVSVYDMNTKLILDRTNKIFSILEKMQLPEQPKPQLPQEEKKEEDIVQVQKGETIQIEEKPFINKRGRKSQAIKSDRKIPVIQQVVMKTENNSLKDVFLADVNILDEENNLVHKCKTNTSGKWQAQLSAGKYNINIVKTDTSTKRKHDISKQIEVIDYGDNEQNVLEKIIIERA